MTDILNIRHLGLRDYLPVWQVMQAFSAARSADTRDELWLLQHPPVFTLGRNGKREHIHNSGDIPVIDTDRGGQVTYHGPGQLMAYVLIDVQRRGHGVRWLVDAMEQAVIRLLATHDIESKARQDAPGVYVNDAKVAALGLRVRKGCSYHGLSLNVDMDLTPFSRIDPCGYKGLAVTQLKDHIAGADIDSVTRLLAKQLMAELGYQRQNVLPGHLPDDIGTLPKAVTA